MTDGTIKYLIKLKFKIEGIVEKADIIGAIFGQTEGLFGPELDLNELQKNWKIGRIELNAQSKNDLVTGEVTIPSSADITMTSLIAAAIESVEKVGPCNSKFQLVSIEDIRATKRKQITERAKEILKDWYIKSSSEGERAQNEVYDTLKPNKVSEFGEDKLPAGPLANESKDIILVEGRADIINLMRAGFENTIALNGVKLPDSVIKLKGKRNFIAFLDGDRGGDLIQKEVEQMLGRVPVLRAPTGKEVEELTPSQIKDILDAHLSRAEAVKAEAKVRGEPRTEPRTELRTETKEELKVEAPPPINKELLDKVKELYPSLKETLEGCILDEKLGVLARLPVNDMLRNLQMTKDGAYLIFDGIVTQRVIESASKANYKAIVGYKLGDGLDVPQAIQVYTFSQLDVQ